MDQGGELKLYVFDPKCHGPSTFVVMETSEERAQAAVRRYCRKEGLGSYDTGNALRSHVVTALSAGEVFSNPNE